MSYMFCAIGRNATTFNLDLSGWNTSKVSDMTCMFEYAGKNATSLLIKGLSDWNTSNVTNMSYMFGEVGQNTTSFNLDLSS